MSNEEKNACADHFWSIIGQNIINNTESDDDSYSEFLRVRDQEDDTNEI